MIESRDIPELIAERLPVFAGTWRLYHPGGPACRGSAFSQIVAFGIYAARLAASRDEASLARVFRFVEEVHEEGSRGAVSLVVTHFLEIFAAGLNELGVAWAEFETLAGSKTSESVGLFRALGLWETFQLPRGLSDFLR
jgi:hypothetical protein